MNFSHLSRGASDQKLVCDILQSSCALGRRKDRALQLPGAPAAVVFHPSSHELTRKRRGPPGMYTLCLPAPGWWPRWEKSFIEAFFSTLFYSCFPILNRMAIQTTLVLVFYCHVTNYHTFNCLKNV